LGRGQKYVPNGNQSQGTWGNIVGHKGKGKVVLRKKKRGGGVV